MPCSLPTPLAAGVAPPQFHRQTTAPSPSVGSLPTCPPTDRSGAVPLVPAGLGLSRPIKELCLPKDDVLRVQGSVIETLPNAMFSVTIDGGLKVLARASGKMRRGRFIRILPGDRVDVELSAYDPTRGRIVWRYK